MTKIQTMRFERTQVSATCYEAGLLRFLTVKTDNLPGRGDIVVAVPNVEADDLPVAILLHGVYGSSWVWAQRGGAAHTLERLLSEGAIPPMILAMPSDGLWKDGSFYLPHHGYDFERWIVEDVIDAVRLLVPEAARSERNFIGGLSMGGFGTLRLGAKYGERFLAVSAHSAITHLDQAHHFTKDTIEGISEEASSALLTITRYRSKLPPLRFDCGQEDLLIGYNRDLHQQLLDAQIAHKYEEFEGIHEWAYWEKHLEDSLRFFAEHLN